MKNLVVVLINGPPESGKDTLADYLKEQEFTVDNTINSYICKHEKFSKLLYQQVSSYYGLYPEINPLTYDSMRKIRPYLPDYLGELKNKPLPVFIGKSLREALIDMSENRVKPELGKDFYGHYLAKKIKKDTRHVDGNRIYFMSDAGFVEETKPVIEEFGAENTLLVKLVADKRGKSFKNDSRSYLDLSDFGVRTVTIENNKDGDNEWKKEAKKRVSLFLQDRHSIEAERAHIKFLTASVKGQS